MPCKSIQNRSKISRFARIKATVVKIPSGCILIDNHDSFVFNLYRYLNEIIPGKVTVFKNDRIDFDAIERSRSIVISPGPDVPSNAGQLFEVLEKFHDKKPVLGICLGHQAIFEFFGGELYKLDQVYHGIQSKIMITGPKNVLFKGISSPFLAGRYHSWAGRKSSLPQSLDVICEDESGSVMGIAHKALPVFGVQFHPESIMTPDGRKMIKNFISVAEKIAEETHSSLQENSR